MKRLSPEIKKKLGYRLTTNDRREINFKATTKLLEKEFGNITHVANINFEKQVGGDTEKELEAGLAFSSRNRWKKYFEPGVEYHIDFGELRKGNDFDEQEHLLGPVFYGKVGSIKYDIGYLFGLSDDAPDGKLKWIIEHEQHF